MLEKARSIYAALIGIPLIAVSTASIPNKPSLFDEGQAAYYSPNYSQARWGRIYTIHKKSGRIAGVPAAMDESGYHCVHANINVVGVPLILRANGVEIRCVTADIVKGKHKDQWRSHWAIEVSWKAFRKLKLDKNNEVTVYLAR
jgi:hypothetical protein